MNATLHTTAPLHLDVSPEPSPTQRRAIFLAVALDEAERRVRASEQQQWHTLARAEALGIEHE